jgi:hypothetical protein
LNTLVGMRPDQMRAENAPAILFDERLVTVHGFADAPGRVPVRHLGGIHAQLWCLLTRRGFGEADRSDWWQRESKAALRVLILLR